VSPSRKDSCALVRPGCSARLPLLFVLENLPATGFGESLDLQLQILILRRDASVADQHGAIFESAAFERLLWGKSFVLGTRRHEV